MSGRRFPVSVSLDEAELNRLDVFAAHHNLSRSGAVRRLLMAARLPGQATLDLDDDADAEALDPAANALDGPRHAPHCLREQRERFGRSTPLHRAGPCPACWPLVPTEDDLNRLEARDRRFKGVVAQATPSWVRWAAENLED